MGTNFTEMLGAADVLTLRNEPLLVRAAVVVHELGGTRRGTDVKHETARHALAGFNRTRKWHSGTSDGLRRLR